MHANTVVIPLLNGMSHLDDLDAAFGKRRVAGGSCQIVATLTRDGIVKSMSDVQTIVWGARDASQAPAVAALAAAYTNVPKTRVEWRVSDNIILDMWEKLAFLSTLAGMTCLMRGSVGEFLATDDGKRIAQQYLQSCIAIAEREGYTPREATRTRYETVLNTVGSTITASMLRDLEAGNAIEAAHIVGYMRDKARQYGIDDTVLAIAYAHLQTYENRRRAGRLQ
jgi:2-dehydropantoate 2-reductase